ncbi:MAG: hypothetical protein L0H41_01385 [Microlunatus sp.]|nr:hypothetical protein [Microlunatus sp.]MDN5770850.1 hypothetical protein [Microlunatus sp.]MDN5803922.1 hypothetical protein [Microlunatus sp.]
MDRLLGVGAKVQRQVVRHDRLDHVIMTDPEGNEFCVV